MKPGGRLTADGAVAIGGVLYASTIAESLVPCGSVHALRARAYHRLAFLLSASLSRVARPRAIALHLARLGRLARREGCPPWFVKACYLAVLVLRTEVSE